MFANSGKITPFRERHELADTNCTTIVFIFIIIFSYPVKDASPMSTVSSEATKSPRVVV